MNKLAERKTLDYPYHSNRFLGTFLPRPFSNYLIGRTSQKVSSFELHSP